jgi:PadR family transcriptional regulator, regulatory protein PadR
MNPKKSPLDITSIEEIVLMALRRQSYYGYELMNELLAISGSEIDLGPGTIYPLLIRLEKAGLIKCYKVNDSSGRRGGHSKKNYQLTDRGEEMLYRKQNLLSRVKAWSDDKSGGLQPSF